MYPPNITQPRTTSLSSAELGCAALRAFCELRDLSEGGRPREVGKSQDSTIHECTRVFCIKIIHFIWDFTFGYSLLALVTTRFMFCLVRECKCALCHHTSFAATYRSRGVFVGLSELLDGKELSEIIALYLVCEGAGPITYILQDISVWIILKWATRENERLSAVPILCPLSSLRGDLFFMYKEW